MCMLVVFLYAVNTLEVAPVECYLVSDILHFDV